MTQEATASSMAMKSYDLRSSEKATPKEIDQRIKILSGVIEEARNRDIQIDTNYLLYKMRMEGYQNYTRNILYKDRLVLDTDNNYIRHFLPRYSRVQEDIYNRLSWMEDQCMELYDSDWRNVKTIQRQTKEDGVLNTIVTEDHTKKGKLDTLRTLNKVMELKQKHCEGQNIQISAVIVQKEIATKKVQLIKLTEENKKLTVLATKDQK